MIAYYGHEISPNQTETVNGFLVCRNVPIARTGEQVYLRRELGLDGDPDFPVTVNRYPEDVFREAVLASFEGVPVTDDHPPEFVNPANYANYTRGHVQNVRRDGKFLIADLFINDPILADQIRNRTKREVSCGYTCKWVADGENYKQTDLVGNHVAVVPTGRAGHDVAIKDKAPDQGRKGNHMNDFWKNVLTAFGMAAKDASPEELEQMVGTTATALDAAPAEKAQEAEPAAETEEKPAEDAMVERAPKGDDLGSKLDRILELLEAQAHRRERVHDENDLDELIEKLSGSKTVPCDEMADGCTADSATVALLKKVRPAVASIEDGAAKAKVVDSLLSALAGEDVMGAILGAAADSAKANAQQTARTSYEKICQESESAYAARNPHKNKEV